MQNYIKVINELILRKLLYDSTVSLIYLYIMFELAKKWYIKYGGYSMYNKNENSCDHVYI